MSTSWPGACTLAVSSAKTSPRESQALVLPFPEGTEVPLMCHRLAHSPLWPPALTGAVTAPAVRCLSSGGQGLDPVLSV